MRLGILADIHGHVDKLESAIQKLRRAEVDRFILLGDVIYDSRNASQTIAMLQECGAVGVWGNHDLGLCVAPEEWMDSQFTDRVLDFFRTLGPRYEHGDLLFSHTFPIQDPTDPIAYYLGPSPEKVGTFRENLSLFPHRAIFIGHFHRWLIATSEGPIEWDGQEPFELAQPQRYIVIVNAVMNGWAAIFDVSKSTLTPIRL